MVPWIRQSKTDFHYLLDIMAQIPIFMDQAARIRRDSQSDTSAATKSELRRQGWDLHQQLNDWHEDMDRRSSEPLYIERSSSLTWPNPASSGHDHVFSTFLHFQTFEAARMHLFYWTAQLLLYDNLLKLPKPPPLDPGQLDPASSSSDATTPPTTDKAAIQTHASAIATLIAQSMEFLLSEERFFLSEEMHIRGVLNTLLPLRTAMHVFSSSQQHRKQSWCRTVFDGLAERGYTFGQTLCGWEWDNIPVFLSGRSPS